MSHRISIDPLGEGWSVRTDTIFNEMLFLSGAAAEAAARRLGEALAEAGQAVEIQVRLRDGSLAGRYVCVAADACRLKPAAA